MTVYFTDSDILPTRLAFCRITVRDGRVVDRLRNEGETANRCRSHNAYGVFTPHDSSMVCCKNIPTSGVASCFLLVAYGNTTHPVVQVRPSCTPPSWHGPHSFLRPKTFSHRRNPSSKSG